MIKLDEVINGDKLVLNCDIDGTNLKKGCCVNVVLFKNTECTQLLKVKDIFENVGWIELDQADVFIKKEDTLRATENKAINLLEKYTKKLDKEKENIKTYEGWISESEAKIDILEKITNDLREVEH